MAHYKPSTGAGCLITSFYNQNLPIPAMVGATTARLHGLVHEKIVAKIEWKDTFEIQNVFFLRFLGR